MKQMNVLQETRESAISSTLNLNKAKVGVEIGVFKGQFSREILKRWDGTLYMIDPWRPLGEEYSDSSNHSEHIDAYSQTMNSIRGYEDRAFMLRELSSQLVDMFEDGSLDWVYIDGNHAYDFVKQDLEMWWPKLKTGGLMSGHDFLLLDWNASPIAENGKDKYVYANGSRWWILDRPGKYEDDYAGVFGVNPAVAEFCDNRNLKFELTSEWTSSYMIIKE